LGTVSFADLAKVVADLNLQMRFNILPLYKDVAAVCHALATIRDSTKELLDREGKSQKRHYSRDVTAYLPMPSGVVSAIPSSVAVMWKDGTMPSYIPLDLVGSWAHHGGYLSKCVLAHTVQFHATLEFRYTLTPYQREHALVLGILDKLGVNLNPAIIWNALPWSFVIDWMLGVSQFLNRERISNMKPSVTILRYCSSLKAISQADWVFESNATAHLPKVTTPVARSTSKCYYRRVGDPGIQKWVSYSGLDSGEFGLAASLAITRR
jgi:hypothetical protein